MFNIAIMYDPVSTPELKELPSNPALTSKKKEFNITLKRLSLKNPNEFRGVSLKVLDMLFTDTSKYVAPTPPEGVEHFDMILMPLNNDPPILTEEFGFMYVVHEKYRVPLLPTKAGASGVGVLELIDTMIAFNEAKKGN